MKQNEKIAFTVGDGAAIIQERGKSEHFKVPRLIIMRPDRFDTATGEVVVEKAASFFLYDDAVKDLYYGLKKYFEEQP